MPYPAARNAINSNEFKNATPQEKMDAVLEAKLAEVNGCALTFNASEDMVERIQVLHVVTLNPT